MVLTNALKPIQEVEKPDFVRSKRIAKLRDRVRPLEPELDPERLHLMTVSYKETEGKTALMRRAIAFDKLLSKKLIYILDGSLIVGNRSRSPMAAAIPCEYGAEWVLRDLDTFGTREMDRFVSTDEEKLQIRKDLAYWQGKTVDARITEVLKSASRILGKDLLPGETFMGHGHITVDYGKIISKGVVGIKQEIQDRMKRLDIMNSAGDMFKIEFYDAMIITLDALVTYAHRFAALAKDLAKRETDPHRKWELEQISQNCERVPEHPAQSFWEGLQTLWFVQCALLIEAPGYSYAPGRMDQYLYPIYRKDIDEGRMTREWAQELLESFLCLFQETTVLLPSAVKKDDGKGYNLSNVPAGLAGQPVTQNIVIGGVDAHGNDASNGLSHLILEADMSVRLLQPEIAVRLHKGTPDDFLRHCAEYVRCGMGRPKFFVDEVTYKMYDRYREISDLNVSDKDLWDYCPAGCIEHNIGGRTAHYEHASGYMFNWGLEMPLERVLYQGMSRIAKGVRTGPATPDPRTFSDFDQFMDAYRKQAYDSGPYSIVPRRAEDEVQGELAPTPFQSTLVADCIEKGVDVTRGGARYNMILALTGDGVSVGLVNQTNSLAVIKKLVFEDKVITMDQLIKALDANWEGHEDLRQMVINRVPKFGNDDDYVDSIMKEVMEIQGSRVSRHPKTLTRGATFGAAVESVSHNVPYGAATPATPDGRFAGEPLNDGWRITGVLYGHDGAHSCFELGGQS